MRLLALVVMLAPLGACDLKPPPKDQPAAPNAGSEVQVAPPDASPAPAPVDAVAAAPDAFDVTQPCLDASAHIAEILIKEAKDPGARAALEQDKTKIIRRAAEGCTRDRWPDAAIACFTKAETVAAMEVCGRDLKAP